MATDPKYLHSDITNSVLQAFYSVRNLLPYRLTIDVYKRALGIEMESLGLSVDGDKEIKIIFRDKIVGSFVIDFVVNDSVIIKTIKDTETCEHYEADAKTQLRLTEYEVCLILNFSEESQQQHRRIVLTNDLKKNKTID
jgi:GxxExxY protein